MTSPSATPGRARKAGPSAPKERPEVDRKYVTALGRGLQVLRCFDSRDRWLANQEIAMRTGLAKPTVTRLAYTLVQTGYLRYSDSHGNYSLGSAARRLGFVAMAQMDVRRVAREPMQSLAEYVKGAIHLSVREGLSMVLVDRARLLLWAAPSGATEAPRRAPRGARRSVAAAAEGVRPGRSQPSTAWVLHRPRRLAAGGERSLGSARPGGRDRAGRLQLQRRLVPAGHRPPGQGGWPALAHAGG